MFAIAGKANSSIVEEAKAKESNPLRESMVIKELSENINDKNVSSKVEKIDAPVASNAKK